MARMIYSYRAPGYEQEPGRERTAPFYREQERMRMRGNTMRGGMDVDEEPMDAYDAYDTYDRGRRMIGFESRGRGGMRMSGGRSSGGMYDMGYGGGYDDDIYLDKQMAEEWMSSIRNGDGSRGAHWNMKEVKQLVMQHGDKKDPLEMWVGMNAIYSDLGETFKKHGIKDEDTDFYYDVACAYWCDDKDAVDEKLANYYTYIVEH